MGLWENLGFYPKGGENPGELWAEGEEGRGLTQVFTGTLWWLRRENSLGMGKRRT